MTRRLALAATLVLTVALGSGCDSDSGPTTIEIPITRIEILPSGCTTMPVGSSCALRVRAFSGDQLVVDPVVVFASTVQRVATVDDDGVIRAQDIGTTTITVSPSFGSAQPARTDVTVFAATTK